MNKKKIITETKWTNVVDNTEDYEGFVYLIVNKTNDRKYIGRKFTKKRNRKKISETAKRRKLVISDSDWKYYKSSSAELQKEIEQLGEDNFDFIILEWCKTRASAMYLEVEYQVKNDVLTKKLENGEYEYYNSNIMSKYFRPKEYGTEQYEAKCRNISKALTEAFRSGKIKHPMEGKIHPNKGKKLPQTAPAIPPALGTTWYTNGEVNLQIKKGQTIPPDFYKGQVKKKTDNYRKKFTSSYSQNPKFCKKCGEKLPYSKRKQMYCGAKCQDSTHSDRMRVKWKSNPMLNPSFSGIVITPIGEFLSYKSAAKAENTTPYKLRRKIDSNLSGYQFIPKKEIPKEWLEECL